MVLRNKIRILAGFASFTALVFCFSCEKTFPGMILCRDCLDQEPLMALLEVKLSPEYGFKSIDVEIYEGNLDDSVLYRAFSTSSPVHRISVPINKKYSLLARYYLPDDDFLAVNSVTPTAKFDDVQCEKPCYYVVNKVVDLRLKHVR
jgi:hypothetical protein